MSTYQTVVLHNPFDEDFSHTWDKEPYTIKAGQSLHFPKWLAEHLAKHLVDRELNKLKLPTDFMCVNQNDPRFANSRHNLMAKCIIEDGGEQQGTSLKQEIEILNKVVKEETKVQASSEVRFCDSCDSKGGVHKKDCSKNPKNLNAANAEFAGLKTGAAA